MTLWEELEQRTRDESLAGAWFKTPDGCQYFAPYAMFYIDKGGEFVDNRGNVSQAEDELILVLRHGTNPRFRVTLYWVDDNGENQSDTFHSHEQAREFWVRALGSDKEVEWSTNYRKSYFRIGDTGFPDAETMAVVLTDQLGRCIDAMDRGKERQDRVNGCLPDLINSLPNGSKVIEVHLSPQTVILDFVCDGQHGSQHAHWLTAEDGESFWGITTEWTPDLD